ncbi:hypothetical protein BN1723_007005, partial [Verticillium longisporum]
KRTKPPPTTSSIDKMSAQDRVQNYLGQLDSELSKYPILNNIEKSTNLLTNLAGFVIPCYYSIDALFTHNTNDDTQWLTYWVVFSFFTIVESLVNVVYWFPFYFVFKFVFLLWLSLPVFRGAEIIFHSFMAPMLSKHFTGGSASTASGLRAKAQGLDKSD